MTDVEIDVSVQDPAWESAFADIETIVHDVVRLAIEAGKLPDDIKGRDVEVSAVLANDDLVHVLNREYRGMDKPTNVLSFASLDADDPLPPEGPVHIGDLILAYETLEREAVEQGKSMKDHFIHLLVHGTLHLLGYDHMDDDEATVMETTEIRILERLNIQNPYINENFVP